MSKYKDQIEPIQPLFSVESTEASAEQLSPSASMAPTKNSTLTTNRKSSPTLPVKLTESIRQHAMIWRVALLQLEKAGLLKRYKIYAKDEGGNDRLKEYRIILPPSIWTSGLELSEGVVEDDSVVNPVVNPVVNSVVNPENTVRWDFAEMFKDGWRMHGANDGDGRDHYWCWRKRRNGEDGYMYGGKISDLEYPIEEMRRVYGES